MPHSLGSQGRHGHGALPTVLWGSELSDTPLSGVLLGPHCCAGESPGHMGGARAGSLVTRPTCAQPLSQPHLGVQCLSVTWPPLDARDVTEQRYTALLRPVQALDAQNPEQNEILIL